MNPLRTLLSIFPQPLHAFMSQGRFYVYISAGPDLESRQPFHDSISLAPGKFDNPYKGAESAGCQKQGLPLPVPNAVTTLLQPPIS